MDNNYSNSRYQRQMLLKEFGKEGQHKLSLAKVLVVGAGGLGCPALLYLAAAGVGTIGIVDFDLVEISNLQRQVLYTVADIGKPKAETAAQKLNAINPEIQIVFYNTQISNENALELITGYDLVIDGSDNYPTRYLVNDACVLLNKPLVYGAVLRFEGQVGVFNLADPISKIITNYRDLFPNPPDPAYHFSCNDIGVLGVLPGIIGTMQATEAIKIILGIGKVLHNCMITYNALENLFYQFDISPSEEFSTTIPKDISAFLTFNYEWYCNPKHSLEITSEKFENLLSTEQLTIVDVREHHEFPIVDDFIFKKIPLSEFETGIFSISRENKIVLFCHSGKRSLQAMEKLKSNFPEAEVYCLKGGILAWEKYKKMNNE